MMALISYTLAGQVSPSFSVGRYVLVCPINWSDQFIMSLAYGIHNLASYCFD